MVRTLFSLAVPAEGCRSIQREETLGPQDARGTGVKLCRADGPAARGGGWHPGPARPLPSCPRSLGTESAPAPSLLPPAPRSFARSLAGSSSLARPRPAQLGQSDRGAERASAPGGSGGCPGPRPPSRGCRLLPFLARPLPPSPAPAPSARPSARGSERPAATMPAARPAAAGPGGIALLLALLLGSPAAAPAGGKRPEGRGGEGAKLPRVLGGCGVVGLVLADPEDSPLIGWAAEQGAAAYIRGWAPRPLGPCCWECGGGDVSEGLGRSPASAAGSLPASLAPGLAPLCSPRESPWSGVAFNPPHSRSSLQTAPPGPGAR